MPSHPVVSRDAWLNARRDLLAQEKALTQARDRLASARRALPWVAVEKAYVFDTPEGPQSLADLFAGRSQLIVKHFMFGPGWKEGCVGCSFEVDQAEGALKHLLHHDVMYVAVSRAPLAELEAFKRRMGWTFRWVSSFGSDFNYDFNVSFTPEQLARGPVLYNFREQTLGMEEQSGESVFLCDDDGRIYHTYSTVSRGGEEFLPIYRFLDIVPKGRDETGRGNLTDWVRHHDRYDAHGSVDETGRYRSEAPRESGCCAKSGASAT